MRTDLGVAVPVYNAEHSVTAVTEGILDCFAALGISGRVVLVDDGSTDGSAEVLRALTEQHENVWAVKLAGNFGQQSALLCGLSLLSDCRRCATMDDDLQHPAGVLRALWEKAKEGFDLVYAIPQGERRPLYRRVGSLLRDAFFSLCTGKPGRIQVSSYRIMTAALAAKLCAEQQDFVYLSASAFRYAPRTANIPFRPRERAYGASGYTLGKLLRLYGRLFAYYAPLGRPFRPRRGGVPYRIAALIKGGRAIEDPDDIRWVQLPEKCRAGGEAPGLADRAGGLLRAPARSGSR